MNEPLFIATERFDPSDGEKWQKYFQWAKIPALIELISLDVALCGRLIKEPANEDWQHIVTENFRLDYYYHLDYLIRRIGDKSRRNVLGLYRNPGAHISKSPAPGDFVFVGYDLIEEQTQISALTNCGGFPDIFRNDELNKYGLVENFDRANEIKRLLAEKYPEEDHAQCELYALWRLKEKN